LLYGKLKEAEGQFEALTCLFDNRPCLLLSGLLRCQERYLMNESKASRVSFVNERTIKNYLPQMNVKISPEMVSFRSMGGIC